MATRADTFYPSSTDQDFVAPGEGGIWKLSESVGGSDNTTIAAFGTGANEIVLYPYRSRSATGTAGVANFGWALNRDGSDGMSVPTPPAGVDSAVRFIPEGTWTVNGRVGVSTTTLASVRMRVRLFRVASDGTRSAIGGVASSAEVTPTVAGVDVQATAFLSEMTFAEDETLLVSFALQKMNSGVGTGGDVQFRLNDSSGNDCEIIMPGGTASVRLASSGPPDDDLLLLLDLL